MVESQRDRPGTECRYGGEWCLIWRSSRANSDGARTRKRDGPAAEREGAAAMHWCGAGQLIRRVVRGGASWIRREYASVAFIHERIWCLAWRRAADGQAPRAQPTATEQPSREKGREKRAAETSGEARERESAGGGRGRECGGASVWAGTDERRSAILVAVGEHRERQVARRH